MRIVNTEKSLQNSIRNALTLFDQTFGITSPSKVIQSDAYLGAMNRSGKDKLKTDFLAIKERNELFATMSNTDARKYIADATDFFSLAAQVIVDSIADADHLPKSQLDLLYKTFTENANALLSAKSTFDTLLTSSNTSDLTYDTQINQLESQIKATELSIKNINDQIASITNTRNLQTQQ